MSLTDVERSICSHVSEPDELLSRLRTLVEIPSPSRDKEGVDGMVDALEPFFTDLGFKTGVVVTGTEGRHLVARLFGQGPRILLIGHTDTVHAKDGGFSGLTVSDDDPDRARGPGAADMKGGIVVILSALEALARADRLAGRSITVLLTGDEEIGSTTSREILEGESSEADLTLVFECGRPTEDGGSTFVTARRGMGRMELVTKGAAAHTGWGGGASAILDLAHKVVALHALNDEGRNVSVNVGLIRGGTAANTVPAEATMTIDWRFPDEATGEELDELITDIAAEPMLRGPSGKALVRSMPKARWSRPPMTRNAAVAKAATLVVETATDLDLRISEESRGGSSDAVWAAAAGKSVVCGMGAVGDGIHTPNEWVSLRSIGERARLAALVIDRAAEGACGISRAEASDPTD